MTSTRSIIIDWFKEHGLWNEATDHPDAEQARIKLKPRPSKFDWHEIKAMSRPARPCAEQYWQEARGGTKVMFPDLRLLSANDAAELGFAHASHMVTLIRRAGTGKICGVQTTSLLSRLAPAAPSIVCQTHPWQAEWQLC